MVNSSFVYPRRHEYADWQHEISDCTNCLMCGVKLQHASKLLHIIKSRSQDNQLALWSCTLIMKRRVVYQQLSSSNQLWWWYHYQHKECLKSSTTSAQALPQVYHNFNLSSTSSLKQQTTLEEASQLCQPQKLGVRRQNEWPRCVHAATTKGNLNFSTRTTSSACKQPISTVSNSKSKPSCLLHTCISHKIFSHNARLNSSTNVTTSSMHNENGRFAKFSETLNGNKTNELILTLPTRQICPSA